jgi:hypothetical protein
LLALATARLLVPVIRIKHIWAVLDPSKLRPWTAG